MTVRTVAVGVAVHAEPHRFRATLAALARTLSATVEVVAIPDDADADVLAEIARYGGMRVLPTEARGGAACFNRLMAGTEADVCILLESGCVPAPRWLDHLLAGVESAPHVGLAGPSTNRAWNAQGVEPACGDSLPAIVAAARRVEARHRGEARSLGPLHPLADFCYAVRREVWDAIGAADEGYGTGPCWEMDYTVRAQRAGWEAVWTPASFVWRAPFTSRRAREERRGMEASRRRYQDRFCALRLRGERSGYEPHCRGDACEHFAPRELIALRIDPEDRADRREVRVPVDAGHGRISPAPVRGTPLPTARVADSEPLVSCIMPTQGRPELAMRAVRYFLAQDWPRRELIVLDDAGGALGPLLPRDPRMRYETLPPGRSIGEKRNRGVELARGEIVAHWDDDDWYAAGRLRAQVEPIAQDRADVTALRADVFLDLARWEFWGCTDALHRRLFVHDVHGGTLVYRRSLWGGRATFPATSLAEDAAFLRVVVRRGARLLRVDSPGLFIYVRHGANAWRFACGGHVDPRGWMRIPEPPSLAADRAFYRARSAESSASTEAPVRTVAAEVRERGGPLVSCLMPTADRRRYVPRAIQQFLRQDWPRRELLILDDGADSVADLVPADARIRYVREPRAPTLGDKRNRICALAHGDLLAHWDDDDWMADDRLSRQVAALDGARAEACGLAVVRYFDPVAGRAWEYRWPEQGRPWVAGNTLLYRRSAWERRPFPPLDEGEDTRWIWALPSALALRDPSWFAGLVHGGNTSHKQTRGANWHPISLEVVRRAMGADWGFYVAGEGESPGGGEPADARRGRVVAMT